MAITQFQQWLHQARTVGEAALQVRRVLATEGIEDAHLEAELLVGHVLGIDRTHLLAGLQEPLAQTARASLSSLVERRRLREPLAHLLGWREFFGLRLGVRAGVLIPRQETETLVEEALRLARERYGGAPRIVDVGCGCGAIAVALAVNLPEARIHAVDDSPVALEVTAANLRQHGVQERVTVLRGDLLTPVDEPVDLVVANLPYVPSGDFPAIQPEVLREPREALDGGIDGLQVIRRLLEQLSRRIVTNGALLVECDPRQAQRLTQEIEGRYPGATVRVLRDMAHADRVVELLL